MILSPMFVFLTLANGLEITWFTIETVLVFGLMLIGYVRQRGLWFVFDIIFSAFVALQIGANDFTLMYITSSGAVLVPVGILLLIIPMLGILGSVVGLFEVARATTA